MSRLVLFLLCLSALSAGELKVRLSWGHKSAARYEVSLAASGGVEVRGSTPEASGMAFTLVYPDQEVKPIQNLQTIWADLIAHSDADTVRRLTQDPAWRIDPRKLTVHLDKEGTRGFSLTVDQLLSQRTFWVPSLDLYLASGDAPVPFAAHERELERWRGDRVLDRVARAPEASYEGYKALWQDMGSPNYSHPAQTGPGHIVCLTWDSAISKFGIDRGAGVWNDYGNPDRFRFWFNFSNLTEGIGPYWKGQSLTRGLPVITTTLERDGVRYEVEQFAYPLHGSPRERTGELKMVLLQRVKLTELTGQGRTVPVTMTHERHFSHAANAQIVAEQRSGAWTFQEEGHRGTLLEIDAPGAPVAWSGAQDGPRDFKTLYVTVPVDLPARGTREFVVKLPSPVAPLEERGALQSLGYAEAREKTLGFWSDQLARGAQFEVPEPAVNDLFRANLWHALRLPRRHAPDPERHVQIDLPYSNFAYDQTGTPWPVNQAVYVDYMLFGLRGYDHVASEEIEAMYRNNQEFNGHVSGFANWLVYTPGMLYAVAQNYLLSGDREAFERVLPQTLKALDWCLLKMREARPGNGLVAGPLNDATGNGYWAFNQAYLYAGIERFGMALESYKHPRAKELLEAAQSFRAGVEKGFRTASVLSPLVQLRDHTWSPYVPCEATQFGRILEQWYPTDVDTGAVHLLRLKAIPASGDLGDALLNDHEDNLFLHGWGIANEPVYNQQATAYLLRDDVKAVVNAFYSYMASAFSHSTFEPVEHRWRWGQYFGPPSTDGAWFELYRNMLVREADGDTLLLGQATPRKWLEAGKRIAVQNAPTYFGKLTYTLENRAGTIEANLKLEPRQKPRVILVRLRHPEGKRMREVTVNGAPWRDFDPEREWVRVPDPSQGEFHITARY